MGFFKLGGMTLGSLFKKPETTLYPFEQKPAPAGLKGHISINVDDCILCGMCMRSCTTGCIEVDRAARKWGIQPFQCIQCGYCVLVCPKKCLVMQPSYTKPSQSMDRVSYEIPEKEKPAN